MSRRFSSRAPFVSILFCFSAGCLGNNEEGVGEERSGPSLVALDSVLLLEGDTVNIIGHPRPPAFDPFDGTMYVSDTYWKRVLRFDRNGDLVQTYGRPGEGPGEFQFNALVFVLDDSTVVVVDEGVNRIKFFDRASAEYRSERTFLPSGQTASGSTVPVRLGDYLWFAAVDPEQRTGLARWNLERDTIQWLGAMPAEYHASQDGPVHSYANHMRVGSLTAADGFLFRGWMPKNELFLYDVGGNLIDSLDLPVVRRQGVPDNVRHLYDVELIKNRLTVNSRLKQLHALPDGGIAFIHHDQEILSMDGPLPVLAAHVWLGVLSPDRQGACVDTVVPASLDAMPAQAFRGDTLFVLDRRIVGDTLLETWLVTYEVDTQGCDWIPLGTR